MSQCRRQLARLVQEWKRRVTGRFAQSPSETNIFEGMRAMGSFSSRSCHDHISTFQNEPGATSKAVG